MSAAPPLSHNDVRRTGLAHGNARNKYLAAFDDLLVWAIACFGAVAAIALAAVPKFFLPAEDAVILFQFSRNLARTGANAYVPFGPHAEGGLTEIISESTTSMLNEQSDAYALLNKLGAPDRLIRHAEFVSQTAARLLEELQSLGVPLNARIVEFGSILHDAGKIVHPEELHESGSLHEKSGEVLLIQSGVDYQIAQCCASHGAWSSLNVSLEERIVALADKLWKGKREADLELSVIDEIALRLNLHRWDVFERLDSAFETIAAEGWERVERSRAE